MFAAQVVVLLTQTLRESADVVQGHYKGMHFTQGCLDRFFFKIVQFVLNRLEPNLVFHSTAHNCHHSAVGKYVYTTKGNHWRKALEKLSFCQFKGPKCFGNVGRITQTRYIQMEMGSSLIGLFCFQNIISNGKLPRVIQKKLYFRLYPYKK